MLLALAYFSAAACDRPVRTETLQAHIATFDELLARRDLQGIQAHDAAAPLALRCAVEVLSPSLVAELLGEHAFAVADAEGLVAARPWMRAAAAAGTPAFLGRIADSPFAQEWARLPAVELVPVADASPSILVNGRPAAAEGRPLGVASVAQVVRVDGVDTRLLTDVEALPEDWSPAPDKPKVRVLPLVLTSVGAAAAAAGGVILFESSQPPYGLTGEELETRAFLQRNASIGIVAAGLVAGAVGIYLTF